MKNVNYVMSVKNEYDFNYFVMPKELDTNEKYKGVGIFAKYLYARLLDRAVLSAKNHFIDAKRRAYIFFTREEAAVLLGCGYNTATKAFRELRDADLIEEKSQGKKKANMIFVKLPEKAAVKKGCREKAKAARKTLAQKRKEFLKKINTNIKVKNTVLQKLEGKLQHCRHELHKCQLTKVSPETINEVKLQIDYALLERHSVAFHTPKALLDTLTFAIAEMKESLYTKIASSYYDKLTINNILDNINESTIIEFCGGLRSLDLSHVKNLKLYLKTAFINFVQEEDLHIFLWQNEFETRSFYAV